MPVPDTGSALNHIPFPDNLGRPALLLIIAHTACHKDDHAAMAVPAASRPGFKCDMVGPGKMVYFVFVDHRSQICGSREPSGYRIPSREGQSVTDCHNAAIVDRYFLFLRTVTVIRRVVIHCAAFIFRIVGSIRRLNHIPAAGCQQQPQQGNRQERSSHYFHILQFPTLFQP